MATTAKMTIRVTSSRSASRVRIGTAGRYISFPVNGIEFDETGQPIFTTASQHAFWGAVLAVVTTAVAGSPL